MLGQIYIVINISRRLGLTSQWTWFSHPGDREAHFQEVNESRFKELEGVERPLGAMGVFLQTQSFTEPGALTREGQQKEMAIKELQDMAIQRAINKRHPTWWIGKSISFEIWRYILGSYDI